MPGEKKGDLLDERRQEIERLLAEANLLKLRLRFEEAEALCRKILQIDPNCSEAHEILGDIHRSLGRLEEAMSEYKRAIELDPDNVRAQTSLAETSLLLAEQQAEEKRLRELMEKGPPRAERSPTLAALYSVIPGLGQLYNGDLLKGLVLIALFVASLLSLGFLFYASLARLEGGAEEAAREAVRAVFPYALPQTGAPLAPRQASAAYKAATEGTKTAALLLEATGAGAGRGDALLRAASSATRAAIRAVREGRDEREAAEEARRAAIRAVGGATTALPTVALPQGARRALYFLIAFVGALYIYAFFDAVRRAAESSVG